MTTLDSSFERDLREALLDEMEQRLRDDLAPDLEERIKELFDDYATRHEYNLAATIEGVQVSVTRGNQSVSVEVWVPGPAHLFETGTEHTKPITPTNANILSFVWERRHNPPQWVRDEFEPEGGGWRVFLPQTQPSDIPEGRFVRDAMNEFRRRLET